MLSKYNNSGNINQIRWFYVLLAAKDIRLPTLARERSFVSHEWAHYICIMYDSSHTLSSYVWPFTIPFWNGNAKDPLISFYFHTFLTQFGGFRYFLVIDGGKLKEIMCSGHLSIKKVYKLAIFLKLGAIQLQKANCELRRAFQCQKRVKTCFIGLTNSLLLKCLILLQDSAEYQNAKLRINFPRIHHPDCILMLKISTRTLQHQLSA